MFSAISLGLRVTNWLNWLAAALLTGFLVMLLANPSGFREMVLAGFVGDAAQYEAVYTYLLASLSLVPVLAVAVHYILTRLAAVVRDAAGGDAFTETNARRLAAIGWALLGINCADLLFGWISIRTSAATGEYFGWSLSLTGWVAVPLLFVLAHVLREGARMREDLEGTI